jgi:protein SCO1/2
MRLTFSALLVALLPVGPVRSQEGLPRVLQGVGFDQRLNQQVPLDAVLRDETGSSIRLGNYFGTKPVILVFAYYKCPQLCTEVLNGLVRALLDVPFGIGQEFNVVTVSFDARETPALAAAKKKTYAGRYGRPGAGEGWHFLTGDEDSIRALTNAVGFHYVYDAKHDQFAHASGIMILTPQGKLARYFYDIRYSPLDIRLSLVEASANRIGSPVDQVLLYCFHYDPSEGKYGPVVMSFVRLGGATTVLTLGMFLGIMWHRERRKGKAAATAT